MKSKLLVQFDPLQKIAFYFKKEDDITVLGERKVRVQNRIVQWRDDEHEELDKERHTHRVLTVMAKKEED